MGNCCKTGNGVVNVKEFDVNGITFDGKISNSPHYKNENSDIQIDEVLDKNKIMENIEKNKNIETKENEKEKDSSLNFPQERERDNKRKIKIVAREDDEIYETSVKKIEKQVGAKEILFILSCLKKNFIFYDLSNNELENLISKMIYCGVNSKEFVFKQNDDASLYFIIDTGEVDIIVNNEQKKKLKRGEGFGELALLFNAPRSASVQCCEDCTFWAIDRTTFRTAVEEMAQKQMEENHKFMKNVKFFSLLSEDQKTAILSVLSSQKFEKGEFIVTEGEPASSFYVIKEGKVSILKGKNEIRKLEKGDSFGELALYYNTVRSCSVQAIETTICLGLGLLLFLLFI